MPRSSSSRPVAKRSASAATTSPDAVGVLTQDLGDVEALFKPTRPDPRSPDTPPGNVLAATRARPLDALADVAGAAADNTRQAIS